ncbi:uncharacterized protein LOC120437602 isoform X3 [Oreochromis aureus]|uniref:uncharacterized protein LOC120437602 isoform X3 n=1 Tax=Oreochromis aureus TaxID=47969 RepID=UPI001952AABD|nr:uncharacterized protein LOC120437602 isoform X3 [Oreochromis aureus]
MVSLLENSDPNLTVKVPFLVSSVTMDCPLIGFNVIEQLTLGPNASSNLIPTIVSLLRSAMNLQDDTATALVNFIETKLTSDNVVSQSVLKVGLHDVVIPAGQVKYVKCKFSSTVDISNPLVLFEPTESNPQLQQLDVAVVSSIITVCDARVPYVKVPIGNHTKHDVTLTSRAALGTIEPITEIVQTDLPNLGEPEVTQDVDSDVSQIPQQ